MQIANETLYRLAAQRLGTLERISATNHAHLEIGRYTAELAALQQRLAGSRLRNAEVQAQERRELYGLAALLRLHLEQEGVHLGLLAAHLTPNAV